MDFSTPIGLVLGVAALLVAYAAAGGDPATLWSPSGAIIVVGGTLAATIASSTPATLRVLIGLVLTSLRPRDLDFPGTIDTIVRLADIGDREGLLSLEHEAQQLADPFVRRGVMLVVDGLDGEAVRQTLARESDHAEARRAEAGSLLKAMGGYSVAMGVLGSAMSALVAARAGTVGVMPASAWLALIYGIGLASIVCWPIHAKVKSVTEQQARLRRMIVTGVLSVQAGEHPRLVREQLESFDAPDDGATAVPTSPAASARAVRFTAE